VSRGYTQTHTHMTNRQKHIYEYVHLHIIMFHQHVTIILEIIVREPYKKNTISIQLIVQTCVIKLLNVTLNFL